ncbi:MAG TPA: hypothetical protein VIS05_02760 [Ilumatobacter sp.]
MSIAARSNEPSHDTSLLLWAASWEAPRSHLRERRGPNRRPDTLEICRACLGLRGPHDGHDNVCACDFAAWKPDRPPAAGDLTNNVILCQGCLIDLVTGSSRWTSFYCELCRAWMFDTRTRLGRLIAPLGRHSLMNAVCWRPDLDRSPTDPDFADFADRLNILFIGIRDLWDLADRRLGERLRRISPGSHDITVVDYRTLCTRHGITRPTGLDEFSHILLGSPATATAAPTDTTQDRRVDRSRRVEPDNHVLGTPISGTRGRDVTS